MSVYLDVNESATLCSDGNVFQSFDVGNGGANGDIAGLPAGFPIGIKTAAVRVSTGLYWDGITSFNVTLAVWEIIYPFSGVFSGVLIKGLSNTGILLSLHQDGSLSLNTLGINFQVTDAGVFPLDGLQHVVEGAISFPDYLTINWVVSVDGATVLSGSDGTLTGVLSHLTPSGPFGTDNPDDFPTTENAWVDFAEIFWSSSTVSNVSKYATNLTHIRVDDSFSLNVLSATTGIPRVTGSSCGAPDLNRGIIGGILPPYTGGLPYFGNAPDDGRGGRKLLSVPRLSYTPYQTLLRSSTLRRRKPDE